MNKLDESLLFTVGPFRKLNRFQIREILDLATPKRFDAGSPVFTKGAPADFFFLLLDGHVHVIHNSAKGEHYIALTIVSGQLIGIAPALGYDHYPATAMTADSCLTLAWPCALWHEFVAKYDGFATETYKTVGHRFTEINNRAIEMATQRVEQRIASALARLIKQAGRKTDKGVEIDFPITRQDISEMTGTTLHTVSRLLSSWEKLGYLASKRRNIVVMQPQDIVRLSQQHSGDTND